MLRLKRAILYRRARRTIDELLPRYGTIKLNVGCGTDYKKGWINIDNNSDNNIEKLDLNWDLRNPLPFPDNSVDFIFNEHFQEHLTVEEGIMANQDFLRVLKPGGVLRIATPDLAHMVDKYLHVPVSEDPTMKTFGMNFVKTNAERLNIGFRWWGHKWIYDWEELERRLREAGGTEIERREFKKSPHKELHNLETRQESTLISEVTKT